MHLHHKFLYNSQFQQFYWKANRQHVSGIYSQKMTLEGDKQWAGEASDKSHPLLKCPHYMMAHHWHVATAKLKISLPKHSPLDVIPHFNAALPKYFTTHSSFLVLSVLFFLRHFRFIKFFGFNVLCKQKIKSLKMWGNLYSMVNYIKYPQRNQNNIRFEDMNDIKWTALELSKSGFLLFHVLIPSSVVKPIQC